MIATKVKEVYEVELPPEVKQLLSIFSVGVSFGFNGVGSAGGEVEAKVELEALPPKAQEASWLAAAEAEEDLEGGEETRV